MPAGSLDRSPIRFPVFALAGVLFAFSGGCCLLRGPRASPEVPRWQDPSPPRLSLREKARAYQERLESRFQTPEGVLRYRRLLDVAGDRSYGDLADACFHTGTYLASQALRFAVTREPAAERQIWRSLEGLELLLEVTGKRGLLSRHITPAGTIEGKTWRRSQTRPAYSYRGDVSKDQYAGFIHGLGVTLAVVDDPRIRAKVAELSSAAADHLIENDLNIIDVDGRRTRHGDLKAWIAGIPHAVNALISLAVMKVAAEGTARDAPGSGGGGRYGEFYRKLVEKGCPGITHWAHIALFDRGKRVNENLAYLALYPLLLLEKDPKVLEELREGEQRVWKRLREERNAFFAFVHGGAVEGRARESGEEAGPAGEGGARGREALLEFPDDKVQWPVDLTREGFNFPRAFLNTADCEPRSTRSVPLYLRPRGSTLWVSNPYRLVGTLDSHGNLENAAPDYLLAYWMGRYHGFITPES